MAMDQMYTDALRELEQVKSQRDRLKEALEKILYEGPQTLEHEYIKARVMARAALEEVGDE